MIQHMTTQVCLLMMKISNLFNLDKIQDWYLLYQKVIFV